MVGEGRVIMSGKDLRRVHVIRQAMEKQITQLARGSQVDPQSRQPPAVEPSHTESEYFEIFIEHLTQDTSGP